MDLVLWRHADAEDATNGLTDHERALTAKGRVQAKRMAAWLNARLPTEARVLVSPAVRAQQTAQALKRDFTTCETLSTATDCTSVLKVIAPRKGNATILLVGHQPTLGQVASMLLTGKAGDLSVKKAAVWWIEMDDAHAVLRALMTPGML